eukprot:s750_g18.t1
MQPPCDLDTKDVKLTQASLVCCCFALRALLPGLQAPLPDLHAPRPPRGPNGTTPTGPNGDEVDDDEGGWDENEKKDVAVMPATKTILVAPQHQMMPPGMPPGGRGDPPDRPFTSPERRPPRSPSPTPGASASGHAGSADDAAGDGGFWANPSQAGRASLHGADVVPKGPPQTPRARGPQAGRSSGSTKGMGAPF